MLKDSSQRILIFKIEFHEEIYKAVHDFSCNDDFDRKKGLYLIASGHANHRSAGSDDQNEMIRDSTTLFELFEFNAVSQLDTLKKSHKINDTRSEALFS